MPPAIVPAGPAPPMPMEYYRREAARVRELAREATTAAIKDHLHDVVRQYEQLAERAEAFVASAR